ncbi:hypothetical protein pdam_00017723 [Pocillopora damicornis]|uniref:Uncharacterized protein n=1 Tax=Pocillopora damicornis TaxID=46731 RepID=A0A3M6UD14_POCDA|nr:hypothetical protein pdam_00017723 [Pocillopora damicornis]
MAGIQSESALPGDLKFKQIHNNYYTPSFKRICAEFEIPSGTDFRFKGAASNSYPGNNKFSDEDGKAIKGNLICFIWSVNDKVERQFDFFMAHESAKKKSNCVRTDASGVGEIEPVDRGIRLLHSRCTSQCQIISLGFTRKR